MQKQYNESPWFHYLASTTSSQWPFLFYLFLPPIPHSHFEYFQKAKVKLLSRVLLFVTPWTVAYQALPSMGFSRQEYCSGLPFPSPGDLPDPGIEPRSPALQADFLWLSHQGSHQFIYNIKFLFWDLYVLYPVRYNSN